MAKKAAKKEAPVANIGFEAKLWLAADKGRIYDPCCGSDGMFVQSEKFVEAHARNLGTLIDRVHRELTEVDINKIVNTYHAWRGDHPSENRKPKTPQPRMRMCQASANPPPPPKLSPTVTS